MIKKKSSAFAFFFLQNCRCGDNLKYKQITIQMIRSFLFCAKIIFEYFSFEHSKINTKFVWINSRQKMRVLIGESKRRLLSSMHTLYRTQQNQFQFLICISCVFFFNSWLHVCSAIFFAKWPESFIFTLIKVNFKSNHFSI